jgi:hypothetical protein
MSFGFVVLNKSKNLRAISAHPALGDPLNGVPRKMIPLVFLTISRNCSSPPCLRASALAQTRPPRLCATKMIGLPFYPNFSFHFIFDLRMVILSAFCLVDLQDLEGARYK